MQIHKYFLNKEIDELYLSTFLRSLAESLVSIYVPVYLIALGYNIRFIAAFYLVHFLVVGLALPVGGVLSSKVGVKKTIAIGTIVYILYYFCLNLVQGGLSPFTAAAIGGLAVSITAIAFEADFARFVPKKKGGAELSFLKVAAIVAGVLGPLLGSILIYLESFSAVFSVVTFLLLLSLTPLFYTQDFKLSLKGYTLSKVLRADKFRKGLAYQANTVLFVVSGIFWPLFIYLHTDSVVELGAIITFSALLMAMIILMIGRYADTSERKVLRLGMASNAPLWIVRIFLLSPAGLFIMNFLNSATLYMIDISYNRKVYRESSGGNLLNYLTFREVNNTAGRVALFALAFGLGSISWVFVFTAFVPLLFWPVTKE